MVSEWQLLADLSFGDFLMWVRREGGALRMARKLSGSAGQGA